MGAGPGGAPGAGGSAAGRGTRRSSTAPAGGSWGGTGVRSPSGDPLAKGGLRGAATGGRAPGCPRGGVDGRWQCCTGAGPRVPSRSPALVAGSQVAAIINCL